MIDITGMDIIITLFICSVFSILAYFFKIFDIKGIALSFIFGLLIGILADYRWLIIILFFVIISFIATKYKFEEKAKDKLQEGSKGERGIYSIIGNGLVPGVIVLLYIIFANQKFEILYILSIACACSDTLASEIGITSRKAYLITNLKEVPRGMSGGVSWLGEFSALLGSFIIAFLGVALLKFDLSYLLFVTLFGWISCQIDSLLGAILESRAILTKSSVNLSSMGITSIIAYLFL